MPQPDLTIVIVNFNSMPELGSCLRSLVSVRDECAMEVIVVDNNSTDGSLEAAQTEFPWCRFLPLDDNYGFARACNEGLNVAQGRHAMLLNPDTEVTPGALSTLVRALDEHPSWGIVGPRMITSEVNPFPRSRGKHKGGPADEPENSNSSLIPHPSSLAYPAARRFPTPWFLFCEATGLARLFPRTKIFNGYLYGELDPSSLDEVDQIEGSALMISGEVRRQVGNLDPQFFIFFEEVDWCRRVNNAGLEIHVVPDAVVIHSRSTTMSRFFVASRVHHAESAMKYFRKHHRERGVKQLRRWMIAALRIRAAVLRVMILFNRDPELRTRLEGTVAMRKAYRRGLTT